MWRCIKRPRLLFLKIVGFFEVQIYVLWGKRLWVKLAVLLFVLVAVSCAGLFDVCLFPESKALRDVPANEMDDVKGMEDVVHLSQNPA